MPSLRPGSRLRPAAAPAFWRLGEGAPPAGAFVALVPGAEAPLLALALPATLQGTARAAVARRQMLDRLGPGHVLRVPAKPGWARALVVPEAAPARWRAALGPAAGRCKALLPDYLALPVVAGGWCVAVDAAGLRTRLGPDDGFSAERELALEMLARALEQARTEGRAPRALLRLGPADTEVDKLLAGIPAATAGRTLAHGEAALDLLRDPLADSGGLESRLRGWLVPAALVVIGALGWTLSQGVTLARERDRAVAMAEATLAAVRRDLIPDAPIVDLQLQVLRAIESRRAGPDASGSDPLELVRRAAGALAAVDVESLNLGAEGLVASLRLPDFAALDRLLADLAARGLVVEVQRSGIEGGGIGAALLIPRRTP